MLTIHKYSKSFIQMFEAEKRKILNILGNSCLIEHIGSTAIPMVDGKGVIDIMLIFKEQKDIKPASKVLINQGYFLPMDGICREDRFFMTSNINESGLGDIHLHLTTQGSSSHINAILFRDYLTSHKKERQDYVDLKYQLLKTVNGNRTTYTKLKGDFIEKIIKLASSTKTSKK